MGTKFVEIVNPENIEGTIRKEVRRWTVNGPFHVHEFRYVMLAETVYCGVVVEDIVEHWIKGKKVKESRWGHGLDEAVKDSNGIVHSKDGCEHRTKLLSADILLFDLPCCGGKFKKQKEIVDYFTISSGRCSKCKQTWEVADGHTFSIPYKLLPDLTMVRDKI